MYILEEQILPIGKKIRAIRKYLKINQNELAGEQINRSMISYIENGKVKLSRETAEILAKNLKRMIAEKKLDLEIDANYLLSDEIGQASYLFDKKIRKLRKFMMVDENFEIELDDTEKIMRNWDIPVKKASIYEIAGDYFYKKEFIDKSTIYYLKSLENYVRVADYEKIACIHTKLGRCSIKKGDYKEAVHSNNYALNIMHSNNIDNKEIEKRILFNNALAISQMKEYHESLSVLNKLETLFGELTIHQKLDVLVLKGNIYINLQDLQNAICIFQQVLLLSQEVNNFEIVARAYKNIGEIYYKQNNIHKAIEFEEKSLEIRQKTDSIYTLKTLLILSKRYYDINLFRKAEEYLLMAHTEVKKIRNIDLKIEFYKEILEICLNVYFKSSLKSSIINDIYWFSLKNKNHEKIGQLMFELCKYYMDENIDNVRALLG